jgi:adenosylmethionine-8-amino-7-oxononanoate aminotransferase
MSLTGLPANQSGFGPMLPDVVQVPKDDLDALDAVLAEQGDRLAAVISEPVVGAGGVYPPAEGYLAALRDRCDRYGGFLILDEVICGFGRLGHWFGSERYDIRPDIITFAKGIGSAHVPLGGVIMTDKVAAPFLEGSNMFVHGITYGGHPVSTAVALKNLEIMEREDVLGNVRRNEPYFKAVLEKLGDKPIVGDVRGAGYFMSLELVRDKETKETFSDEEADRLLRGFLSPRLYDAGLICRADDRGDPVVQLSPPLVATREDLDYVHDVLDTVLDEAWTEMNRSGRREAVTS